MPWASMLRSTSKLSSHREAREAFGRCMREGEGEELLSGFQTVFRGAPWRDCKVKHSAIKRKATQEQYQEGSVPHPLLPLGSSFTLLPLQPETFCLGGFHRRPLTCSLSLGHTGPPSAVPRPQSSSVWKLFQKHILWPHPVRPHWELPRSRFLVSAGDSLPAGVWEPAPRSWISSALSARCVSNQVDRAWELKRARAGPIGTHLFAFAI